VAPDKFKGSLDASGVAAAIATGLTEALPSVEVVSLPMADGGEGTVEALLASGFTARSAPVRGPDGRPTVATYAVRGRTAVVELAQASGLALQGDEVHPLAASSYGTGELVRHAMDEGCTEVVLAVGGSACTDGGAGMLQGLGASVLDAKGGEVEPGGAALAGACTVRLETLDPRIPTTMVVLAADVDNPLLGPTGAARVFGPQKGAGPADVALLERGLRRWAGILGPAEAERPGAGAAGGVGFAALVALGAEFRPGIELLMQLAGFDERLRGARLVITGEGSLDRQSLRGKAPVGIARAAARHGVPTVAVCGRSELAPAAWRAAGFEGVYAVLDVEPRTAEALRDVKQHVAALARRVALDFL
jgi:glycerate kinase